MAFILDPNVQCDPDRDCLTFQPVLPDRLRTPPESVSDIRDVVLCALETWMKYTLFEFNDAFTREQTRQCLEPMLRDCVKRDLIQHFEVLVDSDPMDLRFFIVVMLEKDHRQYRLRAIVRNPDIESFDFEIL